MRIDPEKFRKDIEEWMESDAGLAYFERERKKREILRNRYLRFEKYLETHDFKNLMNRIISEHDENWHEKCRQKNREVHPNNKLEFIIGYIFNNCESISVPEIESEHFPTETWMFKGYYFQLMFGQGTATFIYSVDDYRCLLSL